MALRSLVRRVFRHSEDLGTDLDYESMRGFATVVAAMLLLGALACARFHPFLSFVFVALAIATVFGARALTDAMRAERMIRL